MLQAFPKLPSERSLQNLIRDLREELDLIEQYYNILVYKPTQPRVPAGNPNGGQWTGGGGVAERVPSAGTSDAMQEKVIIDKKIHNDMHRRGWTETQINEAVRHGERIEAIDKRTGNPATRYVHPNSGKSVVIENTTNRVIQVGGENFKYGPESGDKPSATIKPAVPNHPSKPIGGGGGGGGEDIFDKPDFVGKKPLREVLD